MCQQGSHFDASIFSGIHIFSPSPAASETEHQTPFKGVVKSHIGPLNSNCSSVTSLHRLKRTMVCSMLSASSSTHIASKLFTSTRCGVTSRRVRKNWRYFLIFGMYHLSKSPSRDVNTSHEIIKTGSQKFWKIISLNLNYHSLNRRCTTTFPTKKHVFVVNCINEHFKGEILSEVSLEFIQNSLWQFENTA